MSQLPQLFDAQSSSPAAAPTNATSNAGHIRRRSRTRDRAMTSFEMSVDERARLGRVAASRGSSIGSVLRRGVVLVDEVDQALTLTEQAQLESLAAQGTSMADVLRAGLAQLALQADKAGEATPKAA